MKKRVLAVILAMVCVLASAIGVSAANSPTADVTVIESQKGSYVIRTGNDKFVYDKDDQNPDNDEEISVKADIEAYNAGEKTLAQLLSSNTAVADVLKNKTALTQVFDLHDVNGGTPGSDNLHRVTLKVNTLTDKCSDVKVLHYSMKDSKWEILDKSTADIPNKTVTVVSDDLSPIAIFATVSTGTGSGTLSPDTAGTSSAWMMMAGAAVVVLGASIIATKKRSH